MKFHKILVIPVVSCLNEIFSQGKYADKVIAEELKADSRRGSKDRKFIAKTTYDIVRHWRLISTLAEKQESSSTEFYWHTVGVYFIINKVNLPEWEEFQGIDKEAILKNHQLLLNDVKMVQSVPDWLDEIGKKELGESVWLKELPFLNEEAQVVLRVNTLKTTKNKLIEILKQNDISCQEVNKYPDALILNERKNLVNSDPYKDGLFEIQDASSQLIAPFLKVEKGMTVIDACAGAGGKSLHIANFLQNSGEIIALDIHQKKLDEMNLRAKRAGVTILETKIANSDTIAKLSNTADRLLLDVPCSGLGVLRRNPDAKWKLTPKFIEELKLKQQQILSDYSTMLKKEGELVYATCSILPSENQGQVKRFLENQKGNFKLIKEISVMPSEGFDGFYMAKLKRVS